MGSKPSEQFHATLIAQYRDVIFEAVLECESDHRTRIDLGELTKRFKMIVKAAMNDGLTEDEILSLIEEVTAHDQHQAA